MSHPFFSRIGCDALGGVKSPREWLPALPAKSLDDRQYPRLQRSFPKRTLATFAPQWRVGSAVFKCWSWAMRRRTALSVALFGMRPSQAPYCPHCAQKLFVRGVGVQIACQVSVACSRVLTAWLGGSPRSYKVYGGKRVGEGLPRNFPEVERHLAAPIFQNYL
jgi:hypothetical protein